MDTNVKQKMKVLLPEVASMTVETPRRSAAGRGEPGMLTGSERTGWILATRHSQHPGSAGPHPTPTCISSHKQRLNWEMASKLLKLLFTLIWCS